ARRGGGPLQQRQIGDDHRQRRAQLMGSLERFTRALERFSADASHQLRTPLSVIIANLALLERSAATPRDKALLGDSRSAAANLLRVLSQFLALARSEAAVTEGQTDLTTLLNTIRIEAVRAFPDVEVLARSPVALPPVRGNPVLIGELLRNLIFNACAYGAGEVRLLVRLEDGAPKVVIWDHGPGVDEAELRRMFEPFGRGAAGQSLFGTGLGLAISRSIAGRLAIEVAMRVRRPRPGLVVELKFPAL
ncbi:MAG: HAMP domain-containing sensor histidine kinase, partial [Caulobacter sp.]